MIILYNTKNNNYLFEFLKNIFKDGEILPRYLLMHDSAPNQWGVCWYNNHFPSDDHLGFDKTFPVVTIDGENKKERTN